MEKCCIYKTKRLYSITAKKRARVKRLITVLLISFLGLNCQAQWSDSLRILPSLELYDSHGKRKFDFTKNSLISLRTSMDKDGFLPSAIKDSNIVDYTLSGNVFKVTGNKLFLRNTFVELYYSESSSFEYMDQAFPQDSVMSIPLDDISTIMYETRSESTGRFIGGIGLAIFVISPLLFIDTKQGTFDLKKSGAVAAGGGGLVVLGGLLSNWYSHSYFNIHIPLGKPNKKVHKKGSIKVNSITSK